MSGEPRFTRRAILRQGLRTAIGAAAFSSFGSLALFPRASFAAEEGITMLSDGHLTLPLGFAYPDVPKADLAQLLGSVEAIEPPCNVTLLRRGDRTILFDVGAGGNFMPTAGKLADSLSAAGIDPADITDVVFTHAHPDHLWGLIDDFDEPVFPEAAYHMGETEWAYWTDPATVNSLPEERKTFAVGAASRLALIADRTTRFKAGAEVVPGVEAVATHGHTPGHMSFMVHALAGGAGDPTMVIGDALSHALVSFAHPDWPSGADQDPDAAARTRKTLLDRLAADKAAIIGYHLPEPGRGRVEADGAAYRFVSG